VLRVEILEDRFLDVRPVDGTAVVGAGHKEVDDLASLLQHLVGRDRGHFGGLLRLLARRLEVLRHAPLLLLRRDPLAPARVLLREKIVDNELN
jgi:hypothetical protein